MKIQCKKKDTGFYDISELTDQEIEKLKNSFGVEKTNENHIFLIFNQHLSNITTEFPKIKNVKKFQRYLSLEKEFEIPKFKKFNVITGLNGSGKTHFLKAIENGYLEIELNDKIVHSDEIAYFDYLSFILNNENAVKFDFKNLELQIKNHFESSVRGVVNLNLFSNNNRKNLSEEWRNKKQMLTSEAINKFNENFKRLSLVRKIQGQDNRQEELRYNYQDVFGVREDAHNITENEINTAIMSLKEKNNYLTDGFSILFRSAQIQLDKIIHAHDLKPSEAELKYKEKFGYEVPWKYVNKILESYHSQGFEYKFSYEKPRENLGEELKANLVSENNTLIEYQNLSSGEKVLLTLSLFILQRSLSEKFPKILLLDEIDATLHPSLCKNLVETLKSKIVNKGTEIIFATHNPSTVAFCDETEDGIYVIEDSNKINKQPRDKAIDLLSSGVVSLNQGSSVLEIILNERDKELFIFTEGNNIKYLNHSSKFYLEEDEREKIKVIEDIENISGDTQLRVLFDFFQKLNQQKQILFVWDCDCIEKKGFPDLKSLNNVHPFIFDKNTENIIATRGIENLFPPELFDGFINETKKSNGDVHRVFDNRKSDFENTVLRNDEIEIFKKFKPLFEKIKSLLK